MVSVKLTAVLALVALAAARPAGHVRRGGVQNKLDNTFDATGNAANDAVDTYMQACDDVWGGAAGYLDQLTGDTGASGSTNGQGSANGSGQVSGGTPSANTNSNGSGTGGNNGAAASSSSSGSAAAGHRRRGPSPQDQDQHLETQLTEITTQTDSLIVKLDEIKKEHPEADLKAATKPVLAKFDDAYAKLKANPDGAKLREAHKDVFVKFDASYQKVVQLSQSG